MSLKTKKKNEAFRQLKKAEMAFSMWKYSCDKLTPKGLAEFKQAQAIQKTIEKLYPIT